MLTDRMKFLFTQLVDQQLSLKSTTDVRSANEVFGYKAAAVVPSFKEGTPEFFHTKVMLNRFISLGLMRRLKNEYWLTEAGFWKYLELNTIKEHRMEGNQPQEMGKYLRRVCVNCGEVFGLHNAKYGYCPERDVDQPSRIARYISTQKFEERK